MIDLKKAIYSYWQKTPELFSEKYENNLIELFSPVAMFLNSRRKKVAILSGNLKGKRILDVGCGSGIFMLDFIKKGATVVGIDYSQKMLDFAEHNLNKYQVPKKSYKLLKLSATKMNFKEKSFDLILATGLTDYMTDEQDREFLKQASLLVKKNGKLIISFPSQKSPFSFLRSGLGLEIRKRFAKLPPIQNNFSEGKIIRFLSEANLKLTKKDKVFHTMWLVVAKPK